MKVRLASARYHLDCSTIWLPYAITSLPALHIILGLLLPFLTDRARMISIPDRDDSGSMLESGFSHYSRKSHYRIPHSGAKYFLYFNGPEWGDVQAHRDIHFPSQARRTHRSLPNRDQTQRTGGVELSTRSAHSISQAGSWDWNPDFKKSLQHSFLLCSILR
jgi:hypothetical protein